MRTGLLQLFSDRLDEIVVLPKCRKVPRMALDSIRPRPYIEVETQLIVEKLYFFSLTVIGPPKPPLQADACHFPFTPPHKLSSAL